MMKLPFRRRHSYHAVLFLPGLLSFFVYYLTLAPGLQVADAGEQITAAHFLGISHPPGTPLYLMVLKVWELLFPFGAIAWRMNLLNAILGSVAVTLTGYLFFQLCLFFGASKSRALTLAAALSLIFAYSRTYWYESVAASSYLLHYLFVVVWLKEMTKLVMRQSDDRLYRLYLVTGFALANHILSLILLGVTWWFSGSLWIKKKIRGRRWVEANLFLLPGLLFYLFIPLRAATHPVLNWGTPDSWGRFAHYILRRDYYVNVYVSSLEDFLEVNLFHLQSFLLETSYGLPAMVLGVAVLSAARWWVRRKHPAEGLQSDGLDERTFPEEKRIKAVGSHLIVLGMMVMIFNLFFLSLHGSHWDLFFWKRYMVTGYIGLFFSCAVFIFMVLSACPKRMFLGWVPLLMVVPLMSIMVHLERNDRSQNALMESYVEAMFSHLPTGATFLAIGDNHLFPVLYYHLVEKRRPDITLFNPEVGLGEKEQLPRLMSQGLFYSSHYLEAEPPFRVVPEGLVFKATDQFEPARPIVWREFSSEERARAHSPLEKILLVEYYYRKSVYHELRDEQTERFECIKKMESLSGGYDQTLMLTGRALARMGMNPEAEAYFREALKINPKNRASKMYLERLSQTDGLRKGSGTLVKEEFPF